MGRTPLDELRRGFPPFQPPLSITEGLRSANVGHRLGKNANTSRPWCLFGARDGRRLAASEIRFEAPLHSTSRDRLPAVQGALRRRCEGDERHRLARQKPFPETVGLPVLFERPMVGS